MVKLPSYFHCLECRIIIDPSIFRKRGRRRAPHIFSTDPTSKRSTSCAGLQVPARYAALLVVQGSGEATNARIAYSIIWISCFCRPIFPLAFSSALFSIGLLMTVWICFRLFSQWTEATIDRAMRQGINIDFSNIYACFRIFCIDLQLVDFLYNVLLAKINTKSNTQTSAINK